MFLRRISRDCRKKALEVAVPASAAVTFIDYAIYHVLSRSIRLVESSSVPVERLRIV